MRTKESLERPRVSLSMNIYVGRRYPVQAASKEFFCLNVCFFLPHSASLCTQQT